MGHYAAYSGCIYSARMKTIIFVKVDGFAENLASVFPAIFRISRTLSILHFW